MPVSEQGNLSEEKIKGGGVMKKAIVVAIAAGSLLSLFFALSAYSEQQTSNKEELVLTTYYPTPYGDYREMRAERMAVGQNWRSAANVCWEQGKCSSQVTPPETSLIVEGNVGIGTYDVGTAKLAIMGGNVGIGTNEPSTSLDVEGKMRMRQLTVSTDTGDTVATKSYVDASRADYLLGHAGSSWCIGSGCAADVPQGYHLVSQVCVSSNGWCCTSDVCLNQKNALQ